MGVKDLLESLTAVYWIAFGVTTFLAEGRRPDDGRVSSNCFFESGYGPERIGAGLVTRGDIRNATGDGLHGDTDLNQTTQSTAATAEESASATEELSAQGKAFMALVRDLSDLVDGEKTMKRSRYKILYSTNIMPRRMPMEYGSKRRY